MEDRPVTQKELDTLEKYLDSVWKALGIDIAFSKHFVERLNNPRNGKQITIKELGQLYVDQYKKHGPDIRKTGKPEGEIEAILTKLSSNLNIPFVLRYNRRTKYLDLVGITVMRKAGFKSNKPNEKQYTVENKLGSQGMFFETAAKTDLIKSVQSILQESAARHARGDYVLSEVFGSSDVRQLTLEEKDIFDSIMEGVTPDMDEEDIQELSKKTLSSYIKKASKNIHDRGHSNEKNRDGTNAAHTKRLAGIPKAADKLAKEETIDEDEVNELSQNTLANYMRKATFSKNRALKRMDNPKSPDEYSDSAKTHDKRSAGLSKLKKEELEEEEEVNELSKKTLGSYINKASADIAAHTRNAAMHANAMRGTSNQKAKNDYHKDNQKSLRKVGARYGGIVSATSRLTKD